MPSENESAKAKRYMEFLYTNKLVKDVEDLRPTITEFQADKLAGFIRLTTIPTLKAMALQIFEEKYGHLVEPEPTPVTKPSTEVEIINGVPF